MKDNRHQIYKDFQKEFPINLLETLPLERYTNLNRSNSFCYWVESKTYCLGSIWGGTSYKFGIYEYDNKPDNPSVITADDRYAWYKKYGAETPDAAYEIVRNSILRIANLARNGDFNDIDKNDFAVCGVYKWKIAFLYSNLQIIPIFKKEMLVKVSEKLGVENPKSKEISQLQNDLMAIKGDRDMFEFYDYLLSLINVETSNLPEMPNRKYWLFAPGQGAHKWKDFFDSGTMGLGWDKLGNYEAYADKKALIEAIEINYGGGSHSNDTRAIYDFVHNVSVGDVVLVKTGRSKLIGRGVVTSDYYYDQSVEDYKSRRKVDWTHKGEWYTDKLLVTKTLTDITNYDGYAEKLENMLGEENIISEESSDINTPRHYWWLNVSPKIWKISEWRVGDVKDFTLYNSKGNKRRIFQNFLDASEGDVVICYETNPVKKITTIAKVSKEADGKKITFCKTETLSEPVDLAVIKSAPELAKTEFLINPNGTFFKLTELEYKVIESLIRQNNDEDLETEDSPIYTRKDFLNEVYMDALAYDELVELLKLKKNVILQGAPGVGKTFCAERLAYSIMGKKDDSKIKAVQFHQSYSYEDFIMGYKPFGDSFKLRNGVFYNFCIEAANNPDEDFFFIIDEINRGNLSKIFGELLMMIEKDYRGKEITLAYTDQGFHVPENLYIIGMMNTADRSLALIDYALRRRFSFYDMKPGFTTEGFKAHLKASSSVKLSKVINLIIELNLEICKDDSLGNGFEIGHSYFCGKPENITDSVVKSIVKYDIIPTLKEYWFDNDKKATEWANRLNMVVND